MLSASNSYFFMSSRAGPDSPNLSSTPILKSFVGACSQSTSATALPSPPITECSSTVTTFPVFVADATTSSLSSGLIVWILNTSALIPSASKSFAASNASHTSSPVAKIDTSVPSLRTIPFPISN